MTSDEFNLLDGGDTIRHVSSNHTLRFTGIKSTQRGFMELQCERNYWQRIEHVWEWEVVRKSNIKLLRFEQTRPEPW